jgi:hypothetical protein
VSPRALAWPRENVLPGMAPVAAILARTQETVVAVTGIRAYPAGFGFTLKLQLRNLDPRERRAFWPFPELSHLRGRPLPAAGILELTVEFADGRSVTNLDPPPTIDGPDEPDPDRPMLRSGPGTGLEASGPFRDRWMWDMDYRVRPLPPPGPVAFICARLGRGIASSRLEVDGAAIRAAADDAVTLWLDDPFCSND